jgi:heavy metal efflux system protein
VLKSFLVFALTRRAIVVLGVNCFVAASFAAFSRLNIEAYPNPAPVILEITVQAPAPSAEEMKKYFTVPINLGLYTTPGAVNVCSTPLYGLKFVRATFKYGVDCYFAYSQTSINLQHRTGRGWIRR